MADVLDTLHRIRKLEATRALRALSQAQRASDQTARGLQLIENKLERLAQQVPTEITAMQAKDQGAMRLETQRRTEADKLEKAATYIEKAKTNYTDAATRARTMERMAETRRERAEAEATEKENRELEEVGLQAWWRNA